MVRAVGRDIAAPRYRGCAFLNATAEFADPAHPARRICAAHPDGITAVVHALVTEARLSDPAAVTSQLMLVINGLRASGTALGPPAVATAIALAKHIVRDASAPADSSGR